MTFNAPFGGKILMANVTCEFCIGLYHQSPLLMCLRYVRIEKNTAHEYLRTQFTFVFDICVHIAMIDQSCRIPEIVRAVPAPTMDVLIEKGKLRKKPSILSFFCYNYRNFKCVKCSCAMC